MVYINTFRNSFAFDDNKFIINKLEIRNLGNIPKFFAEDVDGIYRPMRTVLYSISYAVWGLNPFGYHLTSLLFHVLNAILAFLILNIISKKRVISLTAALLFAAHPVHTERVTNMTAGFDQLGIFLFLLAFYFYINFSIKQNKKFLYYSIASFIPALLSSEEAATLPLVILLYETSFNGLAKESFKKKLGIYISFFAVLSLYIIVRFSVLGIGARVESYLANSIYSTFLVMARVVATYVLILFFPLNLTLQRTVSLSSISIFEPTIALSLLFIMGLVIFAVWIYKKSRITSFCIFWFFITLLPFSNILPIQTIMAERYLYLPSIGFCMIVAVIIGKIYNIKAVSQEKAKVIAIAVFMILILLYSYATIKRNLDWKDDIALWAKTVETSPTSFAYDNLGFAYEQKGMLDLAVSYFKAAIELDQKNYQAYSNLGIAYAKKGLNDLAIKSFKKSIEIKPDFASSHNYLGLAYKNKGMLDLAVKEFEKAIELDANEYKAYNNLGIIYAENKDYDLAIKELNKSIEINLRYDEAHFNLGIVYLYLKEYDSAKREFEIAYQLNPANKDYLSAIRGLKGVK